MKSCDPIFSPLWLKCAKNAISSDFCVLEKEWVLLIVHSLREVSRTFTGHKGMCQHKMLRFWASALAQKKV